jgi:hypothetical protein
MNGRISVDLKRTIAQMILRHGAAVFLDTLANVLDDRAAVARDIDLPGSERAYASLAATIRQGRAEAFGPPQ